MRIFDKENNELRELEEQFQEAYKQIDEIQNRINEKHQKLGIDKIFTDEKDTSENNSSQQQRPQFKPGAIEMTDKTNSELAEKLREKVMERLPPGGTRKDVKKIVEDIILGDDDLDEGQEGEQRIDTSKTTDTDTRPQHIPGETA